MIMLPASNRYRKPHIVQMLYFTGSVFPSPKFSQSIGAFLCDGIINDHIDSWGIEQPGPVGQAHGGAIVRVAGMKKIGPPPNDCAGHVVFSVGKRPRGIDACVVKHKRQLCTMAYFPNTKR